MIVPCHRLASILIALFVVASPFFEARGQSEEKEPREDTAETEEQAETVAPSDSAWRFNGDFRLRYERTTNQESGATPDRLEPRNREVVRFRAGVERRLNGVFDFGVRVTTGNQDDPNSSDVTLGEFLDDFTISLDRAYLGVRLGDLFLTGGKFANPFLRTDLVWDGDVNPQGAGARYTYSGSQNITPSLTAIYFIVDESTVQEDSFMWGAQAELFSRLNVDWSVRLSGAFYDYTINSLDAADAGDIRGNRMTLDSTALFSDFDLSADCGRAIVQCPTPEITNLDYKSSNARCNVYLL